MKLRNKMKIIKTKMLRKIYNDKNYKFFFFIIDDS